MLTRLAKLLLAAILLAPMAGIPAAFVGWFIGNDLVFWIGMAMTVPWYLLFVVPFLFWLFVWIPIDTVRGLSRKRKAMSFEGRQS